MKVNRFRAQLARFILLFFFLFTVTCTLYPTYAADIGVSKIHPASPLYFLKAAREAIEMQLAQTTKVKYLRHLEFATRRLREAKTLIGIDEDLIPPTLERYKNHLSAFTDKHQENDDFVPILENALSIHINVLRQIYDQAESERAKMFTRSAIYKVSERADVPISAKQLVCNFLAKEASSSALNQTELLVLGDRANKCFQMLLPKNL